MHEQRGAIEARPEPGQVGPGFRYVAATSAGDRVFVSDGEQWVEDLAHELWSLRYGEDLHVGDRIRRATTVGGQMQQAGPFLIGNPGVQVTEFCEIADLRQYDCQMALILVRPDGEQIAFYCHTHELVQVAADVPQ